jgi:hypothetical protein
MCFRSVVLDRCFDFPSPSRNLERKFRTRPAAVEWKNIQRMAAVVIWARDVAQRRTCILNTDVGNAAIITSFIADISRDYDQTTNDRNCLLLSDHNAIKSFFIYVQSIMLLLFLSALGREFIFQYEIMTKLHR